MRLERKQRLPAVTAPIVLLPASLLYLSGFLPAVRLDSSGLLPEWATSVFRMLYAPLIWLHFVEEWFPAFRIGISRET